MNTDIKKHKEKYTGMSRAALLDHYERIIEISQQLTSTFDHVTLLNKIISAATELINTEAASILLLDESIGKLRFAIATNIHPQDMEEITVPLDGSIAGWIVTHGEPRVIENVAKEPGHFQGVDSAIEFQSRNILGVPMRTHDKVIGVLQAVNKANDESFTADDITTLNTLASQAGIAIENARLFQQSDFIAELVHELRNPLAALKTSLTLLQRPDLPGDKKEDIIETMKGEAERLSRLTDEFLDLARLESGRERVQTENFDICKLVQECIDIVQSQADERGITLHVGDCGYEMRADRGKAKQVILNLMTNAIKYNRDNGEIHINASRVIGFEDRPFVRLAVQDTGYGIAKQHQRNMFQKFYRVPTLKDVARGTGLGLAITKHIVEAHEGTIWLESEVDVGSTFYFTMPEAT